MRFSHSGEDVDAFFYFLAQCNVAVMKRLLRKTAKPVGASGRVSGTSALTAEAEAVRRVAGRPQSSDSEEPMECDVGVSADEDALRSPLETEAEACSADAGAVGILG